MSTVTSDTSPTDVLGCVRGTVTDSRVTSSRRIQLTVTDVAGGKWHLVSWEASYSASDAERLDGRSVVKTDLDAESGLLTVGFSNESYFTLTPTWRVDDESVEDWELSTPEGLVLTFGPKGQWQLGRSDGMWSDLPPRTLESGVTPIRDTRQWKRACLEVGLDDEERELASKDLHAWRLDRGENRWLP
jgi:hypothetical protein